jgi:hypothetical protein
MTVIELKAALKEFNEVGTHHLLTLCARSLSLVCVDLLLHRVVGALCLRPSANF